MESRDTPPMVLDERTVKRSLRLNITAGVLGMVFWWTVSPGVIQLFALRLGAVDFHIAIINAILLITFPAQFVSSYLVEKYRTRKPIWIFTSTVSRSMWIPVILMPLIIGGRGGATSLWYLIIFFFLYVLTINSTVATWFSWMSDIVPKEKSGQFWGHRFGYISLLSVIMLPLVGFFLDWDVFARDSATPFLILISFGLIAGYADIYLHRFIPDPPMEAVQSNSRFRDLIIEPLRHAPFTRFLFALSYYSIVIWLYRTFIIVFLKNYFGMSYLQILMLSVSALFGSMIFSRVWGFLSDHFGIKPVLTVLFLGHGFLPLVLLLTAIDMNPGFRYGLLCCTWFIDCCFTSGAMIITHSFFNQALPKRNRSMYISAYYSVTGTVATAAPFVGAALLQYFNGLDLSFAHLHVTGYHLIFLVGFILTIPSAFLVRVMVGESITAPRRIIWQMLFGRVMGISRWLNIIDQSENEKKKLKLLDKIEKVRNPVAVPQLRKHLHDPSERVREKTRRTIETLAVEEETQQAMPLVREIKDPGFRKAIKEELKHPDTSVRKNAVEKIRRRLSRAA